MRLKNKVFFYELTGIVLIFLAALPGRFTFPLKGLFAFNYDQGRDFLAVSKIIWEKDFTLIGQTTGLPGIFYGPWWYYFLATFVFLSGGDPQKVSIIFAFIGIFQIVAIFLLLKIITKNTVISFLLSIFAAFSNHWMLGPAAIWNPTLTPLFLVIFLFTVYKIFHKPQKIYFFSLGISALLVADTTASFGIALIIFLILSPIIFYKIFLKKDFILTIFGAFLVLLPRIIFELRNNFLMTSTFIEYLRNPKVYSQSFPLKLRALERAHIYLETLSESFTKGSVDLFYILLVFLIITILAVVNNKKTRTYLVSDKFLIYIISLVLFSYFFFTIFRDTLWTYYLVALPTLFIIIIGKILSYGYKIKILKFFTIGVLLATIFLNFRRDLLPPYHVQWQGDGGTYVNEKKVIDYITSQNPKNYSFYAYSPAIFDYPFDYLILWYSKRGLIKTPQANQQIIYLVIREASNRKYHTSGWYGDKTRDKTIVLEKKEFPGDIILEKHKMIN